VYSALAAWHAEFGSSLEILLYPSDEFGQQELPEEQIGGFVQQQGLPIASGSGVTLMSKVKVNGPSADPVWQALKAAFPGDVRWNFAGIFVVDQAGGVVGRFSAKDLGKVEAAIAQLLS